MISQVLGIRGQGSVEASVAKKLPDLEGWQRIAKVYLKKTPNPEIWSLLHEDGISFA